MTDAERWIREHVDPVGPVVVSHDRPWSRVVRVPTAAGDVWFKACAPVRGFEPRHEADLFARWPDRVGEVTGYDAERAWLLLADAGRPVGAIGNPPELWLAALPAYAKLQRGGEAPGPRRGRQLGRAPVRLARRHLPVPRGGQRAATRRPVVRPAP
ncbi:MAG: hypothetical protein HOQ22_00600 [Nocardioidaceae bacterium]|nr:hypothetical protein [Nocardioidaceae bacterium]NUS49527.1 hypothetical protein [Nocardioidaceae bacterium]